MHSSRWIVGSVVSFLVIAGMTAAILSSVGSLLFEEWRLVFLRTGETWAFWGLIVLCSGCVAAIAALFRYEQQLIPLQLGLGLLALRILLVLILFLTLLAPVWTWSYDQKNAQRLLIALDVSRSMETVDLQASDAEKIRWAEAVGMMGSEEARRRAAAWIAALEAGKQPQWVLPDEEVPPGNREKLAVVRQENLKSQFRELDQLSRLEILRRALMQQSASPLDELKELTVLQLAAIAETSAPVDQEQLESTAELESLPVGRSHSNLSATATAARTGSNPAPLAGVILFSDGHDTDAAQADQLVNRLQGLGVPVHTVLVGSEHRPRDLSIVHVDHPESVFLEDRPLVKSILRTSGFEDSEVKVFLENLDDPQREPLEQVIRPEGPSAEVTFTLADLDVGRHRFRIRAENAPDETRDDNNSAEFSLNVVDDRAQVLLIEGGSRWEFRFLDTALARDEQISVDHVLFEQPFLRVLRKPFFPASLEEIEPEATGATTSTPFAKYDLVLIGDVSPQNLNARRWQQLDQYVRDEGGTLVLTAGKRFFPMAYRGTVAESLLPVDDLRVISLDDESQTGYPGTRGFRISLSPDGEQLPMFQLDADPVRSRRIWSSLPGHFWGIVGRARGGATVWATALPPGERPSLETERNNALIAQQYMGTGQVIWIGIDSTWRWRYLVGDLYHHRFWGQLVRWAVSFKASAGNDVVRLGLREAVIRTGQPAQIQARFDPRFLARNPDLKAHARIQGQGSGSAVSQVIDLSTRDGNALVYTGQASSLPAGEYNIRLEVENVDQAVEWPEVVLVVNEELTPELQDITANRALLEQIASSTGGRFFYLNELSELPEMFADAYQLQHVREEIPLFGHWLILVLFCGVATTEWVLRKLNGLP